MKKKMLHYLHLLGEQLIRVPLVPLGRGHFWVERGRARAHHASLFWFWGRGVLLDFPFFVHGHCSTKRRCATQSTGYVCSANNTDVWSTCKPKREKPTRPPGSPSATCQTRSAVETDLAMRRCATYRAGSPAEYPLNSDFDFLTLRA